MTEDKEAEALVGTVGGSILESLVVVSTVV